MQADEFADAPRDLLADPFRVKNLINFEMATLPKAIFLGLLSDLGVQNGADNNLRLNRRRHHRS